MAKRKSSSTQKGQRATKETNGHRWNVFLSPILHRVYYALGAVVLFYLVSSLLLFKPAAAESLTPFIMIFVAGLAWWGSSAAFSRRMHFVTAATALLFLLYLGINVGMTFNWITAQSPWNYISYSLAVPFGVVWFFILKHAGPTGIMDSGDTDFSFQQVFQSRIAWISATIVFLICGVMIFYRLGYYDIWEDENLVINASIGISEQGLSYLKDGYDRAWLHSGLNALVFKLFGVSEFTGRLVSALFGLGFVVACFYVFARWFGIATLAILVPLVCLLNDQFLILFRYMRMYALWIPLFLLATYFFYRVILDFPKIFQGKQQKPDIRRLLLYGLGSIVTLWTLFHLQKLSAVIIPAFFFVLLYRAVVFPSKWTKRLLLISAITALATAFGAFVLQLDSLNLFRQAVQKASVEGKNFPIYFQYIFNNGLPANCTFILLVAGLGLLVSNIPGRVKSFLILNYSMIALALYIMAFVLNWSGRDYRYIAHLVPLVVGFSLWILFLIGKQLRFRYGTMIILVPLLVSLMHFYQDADRIYVRHPWSPRYSIVYQSFLERYKPGDALFYPNIKTYYLDPSELEGARLFQTPKQKKYTMDQFKADLQVAGHGYIMWEWHKAHHWREEIVRYIYRHFQPIHNKNKDDLGVELFYFDESMISESN